MELYPNNFIILDFTKTILFIISQFLHQCNHEITFYLILYRKHINRSISNDYCFKIRYYGELLINKKLTLVIVQLRRGTYCARKSYFPSISIININYKKYWNMSDKDFNFIFIHLFIICIITFFICNVIFKFKYFFNLVS